jgi:hypothetical protein
LRPIPFDAPVINAVFPSNNFINFQSVLFRAAKIII